MYVDEECTYMCLLMLNDFFEYPRKLGDGSRVYSCKRNKRTVAVFLRFSCQIEFLTQFFN